MEQNLAAEHLHVIRTLMERSALYRRALAPIMLFVGVVGSFGTIGGLALHVDTPRAFYAWWLAAAVVALTGAFAIARRQAVAEHEPFWSPPTWRVAQAILPPLGAGLVLSLTTLLRYPAAGPRMFVLADMLFYGCAVHSAAFFMLRGMKLFGWLIIGIAAAALFGWPDIAIPPGLRAEHALMGAVFGVLHLAYALYLYSTESGKTA